VGGGGENAYNSPAGSSLDYPDVKKMQSGCLYPRCLNLSEIHWNINGTEQCSKWSNWLRSTKDIKFLRGAGIICFNSISKLVLKPTQSSLQQITEDKECNISLNSSQGKNKHFLPPPTHFCVRATVRRHCMAHGIRDWRGGWGGSYNDVLQPYAVTAGSPQSALWQSQRTAPSRHMPSPPVPTSCQF
jgi:hypothetical protein